ncbi:MAG TPA: hypothetical protein VFA43_06920 [Gemmatimonadaceae bacterium]|nr:hypothetical protein [Gemmatimonadaceae bacterium]
MTTPTIPVGDDTELLLHEIRDEASHLAHHPVEELRRLAHVAADGDSPTTPLLVTIGVMIGVAAILALMLTAALLVYYYG